MRVGDLESPHFPRQNTAPAAPRVGFRPGREKRRQLLQVQSPQLKPGLRSSSPPCPWLQPGLPPRDAAPRCWRPAQAAVPAGNPNPPRRAAPADPRVTPRARGATAVVGSTSSPARHALLLHPERPSDMSASRNLSPRTGSCAPQVLFSRSSFGEKQQKFGVRLPWLGSTTFIAYLNASPATEREDESARPPPDFNSLNPDKKP